MSERVGPPANQEDLKAAIAVSEAAHANLQTLFPLFVDRTLLVTGNNPDLAREVLQDAIQIAHIIASLALADRRLDLEIYKAEPDILSNPDDETPQQDSQNRAAIASAELTANIQEGIVEERSKMIAEGRSPLQESIKPHFRTRTPEEDEALRSGIQKYLKQNPHIAREVEDYTESKIAINTADLFEQVQRIKASSRVELEIAQVEADLIRQAQETAQAQVIVEGEGTFYKLPSGNWRGPGGNYGPDTVWGKQLEEKFRKQEGTK